MHKKIIKQKLISKQPRNELVQIVKKLISMNDPYEKIDPDLHLNKELIEVSRRLEEKIDESVPKIKKIVDSMTYEQIDCMKRFHLGGISHGAISFPAHVCISAAANLLTTFLWARENPHIAKLVEVLGPKQTFEELKRLRVYFGNKSIFDFEREMLFSLNAESNLTKNIINVLGIEKVQDLLSNLPDYWPMSNSGEGGELFTRDGNIKQSLKRQIASGRFGVTLRYVANAEVLEIKINQGAKPGVGGQLPGIKVNDEIALARGATPGIPLISPPPHHDIYSIEDLRQLIYDLRSANPHAKISVKLASNQGVPTVVLGVAKCFAKQFPEDKINITIAGPGGTGAATLTDRHEINQPYELGLLRSHQLLLDAGLRDRVTLTASGGIQTGLDIFKALSLGANYIELGTSILISIGCLMAKVCHLDTCPTGIATTNYDIINAKFKGTPTNVAMMLVGLSKSVESKMKLYGIKKSEQITGRIDLLTVTRDNATASLLKSTLSKVSRIYTPENNIFFPDRISSSPTEKEAIKLIEQGKTEFKLHASNRVISFGARIGYYNYWKKIINDPVTIHFGGGSGSLGQSFGYLLPKNLTLTADIVNDYAGKSLSGGELYIRSFAGNCLGYGATEGFIAVGGQGCGDRGGIRLSGKAILVIRKVCDSACNFMTGGRVIIIGTNENYKNINYKEDYSFLSKKDPIGANFGSGFTGGKIVLPAMLYNSMKKRGNLSPTMLALKPEKLNEEDNKLLLEDFTKYNKHINDPLVTELLALPKEKFFSQFIKFEARAPGYDKSKVKVESIYSIKIDFPNIDTKVEVYPEKEVDKDNCGIGVIVRKDQIPERGIVEKITGVLKNLYHRGSIGTDKKAGDGCGITFFGTHEFFQDKFPNLNLESGNFGVIVMCSPVHGEKFSEAKGLINKELVKERLSIAGERFIPTNPEVLGVAAKEILNTYYQFIVMKPKSISINDFEVALTKVRLRFAFKIHEQEFEENNRANIMSASSFYQTYTSLVQGENYRDFFIDLEDPKFTSTAAIAHERFATNTQARTENIQPMPRISNNGENNNIRLIERLLTEDPTLSKILGTKPNLNRMSDSAVLSYYLDYYILKYLNKEEIKEVDIRNMVMSNIQPYIPKENELLYTLSNFYNLFGVPFEGPNASIITINDTISLVRDRNGFRPLVGLENDKYLFAGSELGCTRIDNGVPFRMQPGRCLFINLRNGKFNLSNFDNEDTIIVNNLWKDAIIDFTKETADTNLIPTYSSEELSMKRLQAGWSEELDQNIMQKLFRNEALLCSMGDQGPNEHFVEGPFLDIFAHFKGKFAQVTNPALAKREELSYMSTNTFVGEKPEINKLKEVNSLNGVIIPSPILDNEEYAILLKNPKLSAAVVSINYPLTDFEEGLTNAMDRVVQEVLNKVIKEKKNFIVISDLVKEKEEYLVGPIHPVLIASVVDKALHNKGIRRMVSICVQSRELLIGPHIAQCISIGGAEVVVPYLPFIKDSNEEISDEDFKDRKSNYKEALRQELLGFMARLGISSVTAYRGAKVFEAEGLDKNVAEMYGVGSIYSGLGLHELSYIAYTKYTVPKKKGYGRYDEIMRKFIWRPEITQHLLKAIKNEDEGFFEKYEELANELQNVPLDWLGLVKPVKWTIDNPLPLCIIGAGAAGLSFAKKALEDNLPVKISIFEQNLVNKVGLIGDGVAPDHPGTRKNAQLLAEVVKDPRVMYYGGIQIGGWLTIEDLRKTFSCIVDSRGASLDRNLNIPGDNSPLVLPASKVYSAYNSTFNPFEQNTWPFNTDSVNPIIGIVGMGNVAANIARILLSDPEKLAATEISKEF